MEKMNVVIITGMSGAGKTNAADWFEDQVWTTCRLR